MPPRSFFRLTFVLLSAFVAACGNSGSSDPRSEAPLVRVAQVQQVSAKSRAFTGTVAARVQSDLGFRVSGKVLERLVDAGQTVVSGQPLFRLDPTDLQLSAQAQEEAVIAARARAQQAEEDELRHRNLLGTGAVSASTYDQVKAVAKAARAQLSAAEAQAEVARNAMRYAQLVADADGVVMETLAEPGQVVSAGQVVVRIAQAGPREAIIQLPETLRPQVGSEARAVLFGREQTAIPAKLRQLSESADPVTRTFEARYTLVGRTADEAPLGTTVTVHIQAPSPAESRFLVPIGALHDVGDGPGVWLIQGDPARVTWSPVTVVHLSDDSAQVTGDLAPGDEVVALGAHLLHEGVVVRRLSSTAQ